MSFVILLSPDKNYTKGRFNYIIYLNYFKDINFDFDKFVLKVANGIIYVDAYYVPGDERCPICGHTDLYRNGKKIKVVKHCTYYTMLFIVKCHIQGYKCKLCNAIFYEKDTFSNPNETLSKESIFIILDKLKFANVTFESVARDLHISRQNVIDVFDQYIDYSPPKALPTRMLPNLSKFYNLKSHFLNEKSIIGIEMFEFFLKKVVWVSNSG